MGNWFKDLMDEGQKRFEEYNKKYSFYDKEGCCATDTHVCLKNKIDCPNCEFAKQFVKTCKPIDTEAYNNHKHSYRGKDLYNLLDECENRLNYSKELLDEINKELKNNSTSNYNWIKNDNYYSQKNNKNIHLSKEEKALKRELNIRFNNTPKEPYIYKGDERIETDFKTYVEVRWNDGTITKSVCKFGDTFNYGYGLLITTAKKFVKKLNFNFLESITFYNRAAIIGILELLIANTAGNKCVKDIRKEASFEYSRKNPKRIMLEDLVKKLYEKGIR